MLIPLYVVQWGTEHFYKTYYGHLPQFTCVSGYTGGNVENPSMFTVRDRLLSVSDISTISIQTSLLRHDWTRRIRQVDLPERLRWLWRGKLSLISVAFRGSHS